MTFKRLDEVLLFFGMDFEGIVEQVNKEINKQAEEIMANTNTYKGIYAMHKYWGKKPFNENVFLPIHSPLEPQGFQPLRVTHLCETCL